MGDLATVALPPDGAPLLPMLERLFADGAIPEPVRCQQRPAYATALAALGILAYNTGDSASARLFLSRALVHDRATWADATVLRTWARSLVGRRLIDLVKGAARRTP